MSCCSHCAAAASQFDPKRAENDRARYQRRGPDPTTKLILEELRLVTRPGDTLLDVGSGIGVIGLELQTSGLREIVLVDAAPSSLSVAESLFADAGSSAEFRVVQGDFVDLVPPLTADIVALDRVVCCYPDYVGLLERGAASARRTLALSFPRDRWFVRLRVAAENLFHRLTQNAFRTFVHPEAAMTAILRGAGFTLIGRRATLQWFVDHWERSSSA
jgi:tRNA1(Val) A37 N6-methylase TrmN6